MLLNGHMETQAPQMMDLPHCNRQACQKLLCTSPIAVCVYKNRRCCSSPILRFMMESLSQLWDIGRPVRQSYILAGRPQAFPDNSPRRYLMLLRTTTP